MEERKPRIVSGCHGHVETFFRFSFSMVRADNVLYKLAFRLKSPESTRSCSVRTVRSMRPSTSWIRRDFSRTRRRVHTVQRQNKDRAGDHQHENHDPRVEAGHGDPTIPVSEGASMVQR